MSSKASSKWLYGFVILQMLLQTGLLVPGLGPGRTLLRMATYGTSLVLLAVVPGKAQRYPVAPLVVFILTFLFLELLHPGLNTPTAGIAHVCLTFAIWCPVFWVPRIAITPLVFANVVLLLWAFHSVSAVVGVLQVYDPGRFAPDPEFVKQLKGGNADGLLVELSDGTSVYRPAGLTDSPGGAANSGSFAALVGVLLFTARGQVPRGLGAASCLIGLFCIYISYVRAALIITGVGIAGLAAAFAVRGQGGRALRISGITGAAAVGAFAWATGVGSGVAERFSTLVEDNPGKVYHSNRGFFLEMTLMYDVPMFPLGAGLGRYGMMHTYFGNEGDTASPPLWAEIQATAWVYDGGIPLLLAGYIAASVPVVIAVRFTLTLRDHSYAALAAIVAGYNLAVLSSSAGYAVFLSQNGMLFWVLNAALYTSFAGADRR